MPFPFSTCDFPLPPKVGSLSTSNLDFSTIPVSPILRFPHALYLNPFPSPFLLYPGGKHSRRHQRLPRGLRPFEHNRLQAEISGPFYIARVIVEKEPFLWEDPQALAGFTEDLRFPLAEPFLVGGYDIVDLGQQAVPQFQVV